MRSITNKDPKDARGWGNFLTKLWGSNYPVDPTIIAKEYTQQRFKEERIKNVVSCSPDLVEGMLNRSAGDTHWTILYAEYPQIPGRERFTIAHELGHYLLHRGDSDIFKCMTDDVIDHIFKQREREANEFASYLLMPMDDFRNQVEGNNFSLELLSNCAERYGTTFLATAFKWTEFTPKLAAIVVGRDGFILWSKSSQNATKKHLLLKSGKEIPSESLIASPSNKAKPEPKQHAAGVWMPYSEVTEYAILSDRYDIQIAILFFHPIKEYAKPLEEETEPDLIDNWPSL